MMKRNSQSTRGNSSVSETVEKFSFGSGHAFADNAEFASKGLRFDIVEIKFEPGRGYEGHDRWLVTVKVADREPEQLSLGSNPGRDQQLRTLRSMLLPELIERSGLSRRALQMIRAGRRPSARTAQILKTILPKS
jgi:hypothetical protein